MSMFDNFSPATQYQSNICCDYKQPLYTYDYRPPFVVKDKQGNISQYLWSDEDEFILTVDINNNIYVPVTSYVFNESGQIPEETLPAVDNQFAYNTSDVLCWKYNSKTTPHWILQSQLYVLENPGKLVTLTYSMTDKVITARILNFRNEELYNTSNNVEAKFDINAKATPLLLQGQYFLEILVSSNNNVILMKRIPITISSVSAINAAYSKVSQGCYDEQDLQEQFIDYIISELNEHIKDFNNPHKVTKEQVGLGNVDNTSDLDKPISVAQDNRFKEIEQAVLNVGTSSNRYTDEQIAIEKGERIEGDAASNRYTDSQINIVEGKLNTETVERVAADKALDNKIDSITAVQIRNKGVIECTETEVQTVATQYMIDNYQRQPKNFDGLVITVTDKSNDKILYIYSEASNIWINSGINDVDLSDYYTKEQIDEKLTATNQSIQQEVIDRTNADIALGARIDNVSESLTNEITRAIAAENTNKAAIETETTNRENADKTLQDNINAEKDRALAAELENRNLINTEIVERKTAITNLNKQVMLFDIYSTETEFKTISVLVPNEDEPTLTTYYLDGGDARR